MFGLKSLNRQETKRQVNRRRGSVTILVASASVVILGFTALAVDYGIMVSTRNQLQRASDAGALAGAAHLKATGNLNVDNQTATYNAYIAANQNGPFDNYIITPGNDGKSITVSLNRSRTFFFAWAVGIPNKRVSATSVAGAAVGDGLKTNVVVPVGISWETYNEFKGTTLEANLDFIRQNKQTFGLNDFVLFDLRDTNAKSGAHMQLQLTGEEVEEANIGDSETTLNASGSSQEPKFEAGMQTLFDRSAQAPWNDTDDVGVRYQEILNGTSPRNNPRVVHLIVTPSTQATNNGTFDTEVQGFAPVYIESVQWVADDGSDTGQVKGKTGGGNTGGQVLQMTVRFLPPSLFSDGQTTINPNGTLSGVRVIRLIS